jgi:hypothetical protein
MTTIKFFVPREDEFGEVVVYDQYAATAIHQLEANGNKIVEAQQN